jgi:5-methylcytosine-specific restriction endonuclease McrA
MTDPQDDANYWPKINEKVRELRRTGGFWGEMGRARDEDRTETAFMGWIHCKGLCVYCGDNLIDCDLMVHGLVSTDHLLPSCKYPELDFTKVGTDPLNAVTACWGCNGLKRNWDPNTDHKKDAPDNLDSEEALYRVPDRPLTLETQKILIARAKGYIEKKRASKRLNNAQDLENWRRIVLDC